MISAIKVAGYCRVSTNHEDQLNSFESQKTYFHQYIQHHPHWQLYEIYADEGITGTSTKKRAQFNRMIADAHEGKFNMIITKEVSRFSRNILDTIAYTRELKALGIGVIFLSDGFCSTDPDAELRLSIMGSIAQEESRKTSTRVKWGQTRQMEKGVVFGHSMLGYHVHNGILEIDPSGAEIVRQIFHLYGVEKKSAASIARTLCSQGIHTSTGNPLWSDTQVLKILKNEKYVGDLIQKKTITRDYLTHERKYLFSGKIICGECGSVFVSRMKKRRNGTSYRRWGCRNAVTYGSVKQGSLGCDVGKLISDELATRMLLSVIESLPLDRNAVIKLAINAIPRMDPAANTVSQKPDRIRKKLQAAVDAYLCGSITLEDMEKIKYQYQIEPTPKSEIDQGQLMKISEEILSCKRISHTFLRTLLQSITVFKGGHVELCLRRIPAVWHFELYLDGYHFP